MEERLTRESFLRENWEATLLLLTERTQRTNGIFSDCQPPEDFINWVTTTGFGVSGVIVLHGDAPEDEGWRLTLKPL